MNSKTISHLLIVGLMGSGTVSTATAAITLTASDQWGTPTTPYNGNVIVPGALIVGTASGGLAGMQTVYSTSAKKLNFDLNDYGTFEWRDSVGTSYPVVKMRLDENNRLSLFNFSNTESIALDGEIGEIYTPALQVTTLKLSGTAPGIFYGGNPVFTMDSGGKIVYGSSRPLSISNTTAANAAATAGALTVAGGIAAGQDSYINGIRFGKGSGNGSDNTAVGVNAIAGNTTGNYNTGIGTNALFSNDAGICNTGAGAYVLNNNKGSFNSAVGYGALFSSGAATGSANSAFGHNSLYFNTTGYYNTTTGYESLLNNSTGAGNTGSGARSLSMNSTGDYNSASGTYALYWNTSGSHNTALGAYAGAWHSDAASNLTTASNSVYIGYSSMGFDNNDNNSIVIGAQAKGKGANTTVIGNTSTVDTHLFGKTHTGGLLLSESTAAVADVSNNGNVVVVGNGIAGGATHTAMTVSRDVSGTPGVVKFKSPVTVDSVPLTVTGTTTLSGPVVFSGTVDASSAVLTVPARGGISMGDFAP